MAYMRGVKRNARKVLMDEVGLREDEIPVMLVFNGR
jgi:hypothetical protein